jgi:hypothetical protein
MPTGKFSLLEEPREVSKVYTTAVLIADGPEKIGSESQRIPRDPMQKLKLPITRSIFQSRFLKTGTKVGGCR